MRQRLPWFVALFLLAVGSSWVLYQINREQVEDHAAQVEVPSAYMDEFTLTTLNTTGGVLYELSGHRMEHFSSDDSTVVSVLQLDLYADANVVWHTTSDSGRLGSNDEVQLTGNVRVWRSGHGVLELQTESLRLKPKLSYAETDDAVTIKTDFGTTRAVGLRGWLDEDRMELISKVRGHYEFDR